MSDAAAAMAAPILLNYKGKEYPLAPLDMDALAMFERWVENRAYETISLRKGIISAEDYSALLSAWVEQCVSGRYRYGYPVAESVSRTREGQHFLAFLALAKSTPTMTQKLAAEIYDASRDEIVAKMEVVNASPFDEPASPATSQ